ncbi:MAG: ThuA domain-containing protein [Spirosomataceae bacterium]
MRKILFVISLLVSQAVFSQNRIRTLVFAKPSEVNQNLIQEGIKTLQQTAQRKKIILDTTSSPQKFSESILKNYQSVVFLNTAINQLDFRQSAELQRFMRAGGGFVGIHQVIEKDNKWLWFQNMIAGEVEKESAMTELSIITNASIGKTDLQPLWKLNDKPLIYKELPVKCKPVLMDVMGKTWAWYYTTEDGGKMFYTALGGEQAVFQNEDFINHIWAGIEEVSPKNLPDYTKVADSALPNEQFFLKQTLVQDLENPLAFVLNPDNKPIIAEEKGDIKIYHPERRQLQTIGRIDTFAGLRKLKLDPEFQQNGYLYAFFKTTNADEYFVKRLQCFGDSLVSLTNFTSTSTSAISNTVNYNFAKYASAAYRLPKYYDGKNLEYDAVEGLRAITLDENDEVKNIEPFLSSMKFDFIKDMEIGNDGAFYALEGNQLSKIDYSDKNRKPVAVASANIAEGKPPLKVLFSAEESYDFDKGDALNYTWEIDANGLVNVLNGQQADFTFTKPGTYQIKLKVTDSQGETDEESLQIKVINVTKKK